MKPKFKLGDYVKKTKGSEWRGTIVGKYSTEFTPEGYNVESDAYKGSVQLYPAAALELVFSSAAPRDEKHLEELHNEGNDKEPTHLPEGAVKIECYRIRDRIYILGQPNYNMGHDCDYMGCGRGHVLHVIQAIAGCDYNEVKP